MARLRIAEIAALLSVSNDTVRRWIDAGELSVVEGARPRAAEGAEVAHLAKGRARPVADPSDVGRSARNRFVGLVTEVVCDRVMARVTMQCGRHWIEAVMSTEAVRELDLQPGSVAVAVVKATHVLLETPTSADPPRRSPLGAMIRCPRPGPIAAPAPAAHIMTSTRHRDTP